MAVAALGSVLTGLTHTAEAGSNRILILAHGNEWGLADANVLTGLTYGGQAMTNVPAATLTVGTATVMRGEIWYLNEAGIAAATDNIIAPTFADGSYSAPMFHHGFYSNVDQANPLVDSDAASRTTAGSLSSPAITTVANGYLVAAAACGAEGPAAWTNATEQTDQAFGDPPGANLSFAHITTSGADITLTVTHTDDNRKVIMAVTLRPAAVGGSIIKQAMHHYKTMALH